MIAGIVDFAALADHDSLWPGKRESLHRVDEFPIILAVGLFRQETLEIAKVGAVVPVIELFAGTNAIQGRVDVDRPVVNFATMIANLALQNDHCRAVDCVDMGTAEARLGRCAAREHRQQQPDDDRDVSS